MGTSEESSTVCSPSFPAIVLWLVLLLVEMASRPTRTLVEHTSSRSLPGRCGGCPGAHECKNFLALAAGNELSDPWHKIAIHEQVFHADHQACSKFHISSKGAEVVFRGTTTLCYNEFHYRIPHKLKAYLPKAPCNVALWHVPGPFD